MPKKYNSKYSNLTEDEKLKKYRENAKEWKKRMGGEKQYNYLHGHCDVCHNDYANIYEHRKSNKHKKNEELNNIEKITTTTEDNDEAEHLDVLLKV